MTPAQIDIARRLVAAPWWRWAPGMHARLWTRRDPMAWGRVRITDVPLFTENYLNRESVHGWTPPVPDLTDAGTGGVLLGMLAAEVPGVETGYSAEWWVRAWTGAEWTRPGEGTTLAEAAALVLLVLLEVRGG